MKDADSHNLAQTADTYFVQGFDKPYLVNTLSRLAQIPTEVPLGYETFIEPDDPKLVHYVQNILRPELVQLGYYDLIDAPRNNLVVRAGRGESGRVLLIQNYTPAQHFNYMDNPFSGHVGSAREFGHDEPAIFGQGVSQNKAHQAVMLAVLKLLHTQTVPLKGRLYWAINNEGRSSHACSEAILDTLDEKPEFCIIQIGTGMKLWLGNRGRVDVNIHVRGRATHSSSPEAGLSAIDGANEVLNRLKQLSWADTHPLLGGRHAVPYKIRYEPVAPHTLPSDAYITVDRRLIPGDNTVDAVQEIRNIIGNLAPYEVTVEQGVTMLPALVDDTEPGVQVLQRAHQHIHNEAVDIVYGGGAFDSGGLIARGVPTVMYGASGGDGLLGTDYVLIRHVIDEARVLLHTIMQLLA